jgi:hypothetical protein
MMHGIKDPEFRFSCGAQNFDHMLYAAVGLGNSFDPRPDFATFGDEVVIRIDHQQGSRGLVVCGSIHDVPSSVITAAGSRPERDNTSLIEPLR